MDASQRDKFYSQNSIQRSMRNVELGGGLSAEIQTCLIYDTATYFMDLSSRVKFIYGWREFVGYYARFVCCRLRRNIKHSESTKAQYLYKRAEKQLSEDLDAVKLVKDVKMMKLIVQSLLNNR